MQNHAPTPGEAFTWSIPLLSPSFPACASTLGRGSTTSNHLHVKEEDGEVVVAKRMIVKGRVQGVSYRAFARKHAKMLGLCGWARNLASGSVEIHAEGDEGAVSQYIERLRKGPPLARVDEVSIDDGSNERLSAFEILTDGDD